MLHMIAARQWNEPFSDDIQQHAIRYLENGQVLFFPQLSFSLTSDEHIFLTPDYVDPESKNISYHPSTHQLKGIRNLSIVSREKLKLMLRRFSQYASDLVKQLFPSYALAYHIGRTSFRPVQISDRKTSYRKDDKRLHVDAFPANPNQGKRILRVFSNINPYGHDRVWRLGEDFERVVEYFVPRIKKPLKGTATLLKLIKMTKSYRTLYDHYMLQIHDAMKADETYQANADQQVIRFPAATTWIVQTDHVSHAAMQGQYVLEQTFYLPVTAMQNPAKSPLRILENFTRERLV